MVFGALGKDRAPFSVVFDSKPQELYQLSTGDYCGFDNRRIKLTQRPDALPTQVGEGRADKECGLLGILPSLAPKVPQGYY